MRSFIRPLVSPRTLAAASFCTASLAASAAHATPKPLPFSYGYSTQPEGGFEVEQYMDIVPVRVPKEADDGTQKAVTSTSFDLQTELEYGLTDRLELGFYFVFHQGPSPDTPFLYMSGTRQRLRLRLAERGEWPVDVGTYLEVSELHNEIEIEEKILLSKALGKFSLVSNLWVEQEYYFQLQQWKFIYNPTAAVTYEVRPGLIVGLEYWARGRFDKHGATSGTDDPSTNTRHYVGPTINLERGPVWASLGVYPRLDTLGKGVAVGDVYGPIWVRVLLGIELF
jgi:hypothetical protein